MKKKYICQSGQSNIKNILVSSGSTAKVRKYYSRSETRL